MPDIRSSINKTEYFINMSKEVNGNKYNYDKTEYIGNDKKLIVTCNIHGDFKVAPHNHLKGKGCKECGMEKSKIQSKTRKTHEDFLIEIKNLSETYYNELTFIEEYKSCKTPILAKDRFGILKIVPSTLLERLKSWNKNEYLHNVRGAINQTEYWLNFMKYSREDCAKYYYYSKFEYNGSFVNSIIICPKHGEFEQNPVNHSKGCGCPKCNSSKGEDRIRRFLKKHKIDFLEQYKFEDCKNIYELPFDFYITDLKILIEFDGIQHTKPIEIFGGENAFKKTKNNDNIKTEYCKDNNIKLVRIPHWDFDNIEEILRKELNL